jgi:hypothetical protein
MRCLNLIVMAALLAACQTSQLPITNIATVTPSVTGAEGVDVYAGKRRAGEAVPDFRGDQLVEVRSYGYEKSENSSRPKKVEFSGARCNLEGTGFMGNVTTPAKVRVPIYGNASSELAVRCVADGRQPVIQTARAYNKTKSDRLESGSNGGLLGVVFVAAVNAASDETKHVFLYPAINVQFK